MHRRARHLNPDKAGATCALDARFISGVSNGSNISSWTDRSSSANTPSNSGLSNNQPLYQSSGFSGQPTVLFDGAADSTNGRSLSWSTTPISSATEVTAIIAFKRTTGSSTIPGAHLTNLGTGIFNDHTPWSDGRYYVSYGIGSRVDFVAPTTLDVLNIESYKTSGSSWNLYHNSVLFFTNTGTSISIGSYARIGSNGGPSDSRTPDGLSSPGRYYWTGHIGSISLYKSALSDSLRRRIEHSAAFSYKIACS